MEVIPMNDVLGLRPRCQPFCHSARLIHSIESNAIVSRPNAFAAQYISSKMVNFLKACCTFQPFLLHKVGGYRLGNSKVDVVACCRM